MNTKKQDIIKRMKALAINTGKLCLRFPHNIVNKTYISQIVRCSSAAPANYRAACRGKSKADFINKLRMVEEEPDETMHFYELLSIKVASINTTLKNMAADKGKADNLTSNLKSAI